MSVFSGSGIEKVTIQDAGWGVIIKLLLDKHGQINNQGDADELLIVIQFPLFVFHNSRCFPSIYFSLIRFFDIIIVCSFA